MQGPVGSGKTSTVEYLALITGRQTLFESNGDNISNSSKFLKVQLGEQTDSRMLIGGYQCTEIPGQFVWKPGVLTQVTIKIVFNFLLNGYNENEFFFRLSSKDTGCFWKI